MDKFACLRAFTQVVQSSGFAAAGRELGLSRSAVNKLVLQLENELGTQLLYRSTRQVRPTEAGLAFYERCVALLADLTEAEQSVRQLQAEPKGKLRINAPMTFGTMYLAPAVSEFLGQYPDLQVQLTLSDRFIDPIEEGFDVTIRIARPQTVASLVVQELMPAPQVLCAAPAYLDQKGVPHHLSDLRDHSCLHYGHLTTDNHWTLMGPEGEQTVSIQGAICSNNGEVLRAAAVQGLGITLLPTFLVEPDLTRGSLQIVLPHYHPSELTIYALYPVNRHLLTKVRLWVEFLQQRFSSQLHL